MSAIAASIWFEMPNSGHKVLIPAERVNHALIEKISPGEHGERGCDAVRKPVSPVLQRRHKRFPSKSCNMNRPARVPASTAVRMNSASNRIAK